MTPLRWPSLVAALAAVVALALAACGGDDEGATAATTGTDGVELKVGQFSWTAAEVQVEILKAIAEAHPELGVRSIKSVPVDPAAGWVGIKRGDLDVLTEVMLPNQRPLAERASAEVDLVAEVYDGAVQGWFVPRYAVAADGPLAGLRRVDQVNAYTDKVDALYDGDPGWITTQQNRKRIAAYGLGIRHATSSEAALIAQVRRAYERREPVLFAFYRPHWLFQRFDLVQLAEPNPYRPGCFEGGRDRCAIATQASWIAARKDLAERAPRFASALRNVRIPLEEIEALLFQVDGGEEPTAVARRWVEGHRAEVDAWLS